LAGSCTVPLGAYAHIVTNHIHLSGFVAKPDGSQIISASITGSVDNPEKVGAELSDILIANGALKLLNS